MKKRAALLCLLFICVQCATAQSQSSNVYQVLFDSAVVNGAVPSFGTYTGPPCELGQTCTQKLLTTASNYEANPKIQPIFGLGNALNANIATALSVIPIASPASGVITKVDPATGAELPVDYTLGPVFAERAETIGKHKFYIGFSNQDFHFTSLNGVSTKTIQMMDPGGDPSNIFYKGQRVNTFPSTFDVGMDVRLTQNLALLTYGVTSRFDVSVGLPLIHAAVSAQTSNVLVYEGNGLNNAQQGNCWCVGTYTSGNSPTTAPSRLGGLVIPVVNNSRAATTGFGDMLLRFKGTAVERSNFALALGTDLRLPTGDERNFLGTGAPAIRPFLALSLYTKPLSHGIVLSPHLNVAWQVAGKSILGGQTSGELTTITPSGGTPFVGFGPPFSTTKGYLPDVFSWVVGSELALGRHHTIIIDVLGNQIGWLHGIPNLVSQSISNVPLPSSNAQAQLGTATGLVTTHDVSFGQYSGAFGYKAKIAGNLVGTFNMLVRFDNNGLTARAVPLFGLAYTF